MMYFTLSQIAANSGEAAQIGQHRISKAERTEFPEKRFGWKPDRRMEAASVWFVEYRAQCAGGMYHVVVGTRGCARDMPTYGRPVCSEVY